MTRTVQQQIDDLGTEASFTFDELVNSDLDPKSKANGEHVRVEGIRRWVTRAKGRTRRDIEFLLALVAHKAQVIEHFSQQAQQAQFAAARLAERVKRFEEEKAEKPVVVASEGDLRRELAARRRA